MKKEPVKTVQFYASEDDHAFPRPNLPVKPRISQDAAVDYDRGTELERAGGEIIELSRSEWKELQAA